MGFFLIFKYSLEILKYLWFGSRLGENNFFSLAFFSLQGIKMVTRSGSENRNFLI